MSVPLIKGIHIPVLKAHDWVQQKINHEYKAEQLLDDYLEQRSKHEKNPVMDFLFEYYTFRPSQLKRWSPGFGKVIEFQSLDDLPEISELSVESNRAYLSLADFPSNRISSLKWILQLLKQSQKNNPSFGCHGMHEWAMVYKTDQPRHSHIPLRMKRDKLAEFVESMPLMCTHFDAFRFFTPEAQPMNRYSLSRKKFLEMEQSGCIHNNMDLYKWAFKMYPWTPSSLILSAFKFAHEARVIDMKASPYDLRSYNLEPIKIETEEGRKIYRQKQRHIWEKGKVIRRKLINFYENLSNALMNVNNTYS